MRNLDERIGNVGMPDEGHAIHGSAYIDGFGRADSTASTRPFGPVMVTEGGSVTIWPMWYPCAKLPMTRGWTEPAGQPHIECEMEWLGTIWTTSRPSGLMNLLRG